MFEMETAKFVFKFNNNMLPVTIFFQQLFYQTW